MVAHASTRSTATLCLAAHQRGSHVVPKCCERVRGEINGSGFGLVTGPRSVLLLLRVIGLGLRLAKPHR